MPRKQKHRAGTPHIELGASAHYRDPAYYDQAYRNRDADVRFYAELARSVRGPVLEYGVGTGRVALAMAGAGADVLGVDASEEMLSGLAAKLAREPDDVRHRVTVVAGDMRRVRLRRRFPLVVAPFNTLLHLYTRPDIEAFLERVLAHLEPGGRFVFDVSLPHPSYLGADPARRYGSPRFRHPSRGLVRYAERFDYDPGRQVLVTRMEFSPEDGSPPWTVLLTQRQFFPLELEALLHYAGFGQITFGADFSESPSLVDADSVVISCRKPGRAVARRRGSPKHARTKSKMARRTHPA